MLLCSIPVGAKIYLGNTQKSPVGIKISRLIYKMVLTTPTVKLNNGYEMPLVGLGTYAVSFYSLKEQRVIIKYHY